jgi:hypothetical protein
MSCVYWGYPAGEIISAIQAMDRRGKLRKLRRGITAIPQHEDDLALFFAQLQAYDPLTNLGVVDIPRKEA